MRRHIVLVIAVAALLLAGVNLLFFRGERTSVPEEPRPERKDSGTRVVELARRLDQLEGRLADALAHLEGSSSLSASGEGAEGAEKAEEATTDALGEIARLGFQISDLSRRIEALEEDPINRGYIYATSESAVLRREGINALKQFAGSDPAAREAIRNLLYDPNERVRREAADALGDLGDRESAGLMAELLSDPDAGVRREAIDTFADWGYREASPLVARMLNDPQADVRREAIRALSTLNASEAGNEIARLLSDPSDGVREEAADVLGELKARESTTALLQALNDGNEEVRGEAIASLGEVGAVEAIPYLKDMYQRDPGRHRLRLITAMRALGDEAPFQQEVQRLSGAALSSESPEARRGAIRTLSGFARREAREVFTQALEDPNDSVRREAQRALGRN